MQPGIAGGQHDAIGNRDSDQVGIGDLSIPLASVERFLFDRPTDRSRVNFVAGSREGDEGEFTVFFRIGGRWGRRKSSPEGLGDDFADPLVGGFGDGDDLLVDIVRNSQGGPYIYILMYRCGSVKTGLALLGSGAAKGRVSLVRACASCRFPA